MRFKEVVEEIVEEYGSDLSNENIYIRIEAEQKHIEDLSVERNNQEIIVTQFYTKNGDLMRDPEVRFQIQEDGSWKPVSYRLDPSVYQYCGDGLDLDDVLSTWATNLEEQFLP